MFQKGSLLLYTKICFYKSDSWLLRNCFVLLSIILHQNAMFQGLVTGREKESETEDHLLKIAQREEGRLKQEVSRLKKEMDELKEKKNSFEVCFLFLLIV